MDQALQALNFRIARGEEFPDACYAVSVKYGVDYTELADAYDAQGTDTYRTLPYTFSG